jgi:hypothetical protein
MIPPALSMFLTRRLDRSPHPKAPHLRIALTFSFPAILEDHVAVSLVLTDIKLPGSMEVSSLLLLFGTAGLRSRSWPLWDGTNLVANNIPKGAFFAEALQARPSHETAS